MTSPEEPLPLSRVARKAARASRVSGWAMLLVSGLNITSAVLSFAAFNNQAGWGFGVAALIILAAAATWFNTARTHDRTAAIYERLEGRVAERLGKHCPQCDVLLGGSNSLFSCTCGWKE